MAQRSSPFPASSGTQTSRISAGRTFPLATNRSEPAKRSRCRSLAASTRSRMAAEGSHALVGELVVIDARYVDVDVG